MKKFIVLYKANKSAMVAMSIIKKEEQQKSMIDWHVWRDNLGENLVEFGSMFLGGISLDFEGEKTSLGDTIGYTLIQAENQEKANELILNHPHLKWHKGASIEIREYMKMP